MYYALTDDFRRLNAQYGFGGLGDECAAGARQSGEPRDFVAERDDREALASRTGELAIDEHIVDFARARHPDWVDPVAPKEIAGNQSGVADFRGIKHRY